jgi:thiol-disulfide isomerase/thioredoxin
LALLSKSAWTICDYSEGLFRLHTLTTIEARPGAAHRSFELIKFVAIILTFVAGVAVAAEGLDLERQAGKVVVVDFWASWCVPCRRSFPWMNEMHDKYADQGLVIIAVNLDNTPEDATLFLKDYPARFQINYDTDKSVAREFGVQAMPSSFLFGRDGEIIDSHLGFKVKQKAEYEAAIVDALAEKVSAD